MTGDWRATFGGSAAVSVYEGVLVPRLFVPLAEVLLDLVGLQPGDRVLDVACGPGTVAQLAAARVGPTGRVVGCDISPAMLEAARAAAPSLEWVETPAAPLVGIDDDSFDVVTCQQGIQFFPDRPAAVAEMRRVLVPGNRAVIAVWGPIERSTAFAALAAATGDVLGEEAAQRYRAGPYGFPEAEALAELVHAGGFHEVRLTKHTVSCDFDGGAAQLASVLLVSPVAEAVAALSDDDARALVEAVCRRTAPITEDGVIHGTLECNVAIGVKP